MVFFLNDKPNTKLSNDAAQRALFLSFFLAFSTPLLDGVVSLALQRL